MANFCTNCGAKLRNDDNFCSNCGTKIDRHDINENNHLLNSVLTSLEKKNDKEKEEEKKKFIKTGKEQEKAKISKEMSDEKIEKNEMINGGYCSLSCIHCYEEFLDNGGNIVGDFDSDGIVEYYCNLGHYVAFGSFCEDYE